MKRRYFIYLILIALFISFITADPVFEVMKAQNINIEKLLTLGKKHYYDGDLKKSREKFNLVLKNDSDNINALKNNIIINKELGNKEQVIRDYKKLLQIDESNSSLKYKYGITLYQFDMHKKAKNILKQIINKKKVIKLNKFEWSTVYYYIGEIYVSEGSYQKAIKSYEKGIKNYDHNILNYLGKANVYYKFDNYKKALDYYKKALKKDGSLSLLYPKLAVCYEQLDNISMAYLYWKKSLTSGIAITKAKKKIKNMVDSYPGLQKKKKEKIEINKKVKWQELRAINNNKKIPELKIGLLDKISRIVFKSRDSFNVINKNNNEVLFKGSASNIWEVKYEDGYYLFSSDNTNKKIESENILINTNQFVIFAVSYGQGYFWSGTENRQYRGQIELRKENNENFTLINIVNIEEYLLSVVPSEIPSWWPKEAIKAQSIAARTYALKNKKLNRHDSYDLCDGVHCAVYTGVNVENSRTHKAIQATQGEVITSNNKFVNAVFSSNSGGYTESSEDIWGTKVEYLKGVKNINNDSLSFPLFPFKLNNWILDKEKTDYYTKYSSSNTFRWLKVIPAQYFIDKYDLKSIKNIIATKRSKGGSIKKVLIRGKEKEITIKGDSIRSGMGGLKSNRFVLSKIYNEEKIEKIIINGSGWGHSVGLDQTASAGMAGEGLNYKEILTHFYQNTKIKKIY